MTYKVELVIDKDCPNVDAAREQLRNAFAAIGETPVWDEWDREADGVPSYVTQYGSPTILVDEQDVDGQGSESDSNCCRVYRNADGRFQGVPTVEKIVVALQGRTVPGAAERHPNQKRE